MLGQPGQAGLWAKCLPREELGQGQDLQGQGSHLAAGKGLGQLMTLNVTAAYGTMQKHLGHTLQALSQREAMAEVRSHETL